MLIEVEEYPERGVVAVGISCHDSGPQCWWVSPGVENSSEEEKTLDLKLKPV